MTVKHQIQIDANVQKVWAVLTQKAFIAQWDELPENFTDDVLQLGSTIEWEGYSRLTVVGFDALKRLQMDLFLPKVALHPGAYDISYTFLLTGTEGKTVLDIVIGDFSPIPNAQSYYDASMEFAHSSGQKIKALSEK